MEIEVRVPHSQREAILSCVIGFLDAVGLPCWFSVSQNKNYCGDANAPRPPLRDSAQVRVLHEYYYIYFFDLLQQLQQLTTMQ